MPSRNVMLSGRYPHNNRVEGFYQVANIGYPVMVDLMKRRRLLHRHPAQGRPLHAVSPVPAGTSCSTRRPDGTRRTRRTPASYGASTQQGIAAAREAGKPFCLNINVADPHKPFYAEGSAARRRRPERAVARLHARRSAGARASCSTTRWSARSWRTTTPRSAAPTTASAASSRRSTESGEAERTVVVFLSDHGMPLPFAKTQLYHHSTPHAADRPLARRDEGRRGRRAAHGLGRRLPADAARHRRHRASRGARRPQRSLPLLRGEQQDGRDMVVKEYNENAGGHRNPMRAVQTQRLPLHLQPLVQRQPRDGAPPRTARRPIAA